MIPDSFLLWSGRRFPEVYAAQSLLAAWHQLCVSVKVLDTRGHPPRLHDLRHSFAVNALQRWYSQGLDVQAKLPHLANYLGHVSPVSTHYYLQFTEELSQSASRRFPQRIAPLFTAGWHFFTRPQPPTLPPGLLPSSYPSFPPPAASPPTPPHATLSVHISLLPLLAGA